MSEFDIYTIDTKIAENQARIDRFTRAIQKINSNSQQLEARSVETLNRVAMVEVVMAHTSEYTIRLGAQYYARVKAPAALQLLDSRVKYYEEQNTKWHNLKEGLVKKVQTAKDPLGASFGDFDRPGISVIGKNEDDEDIFNIVQYSQPPLSAGKNSTKLQIIRESKQEQTNQHMQQQARQPEVIAQPPVQIVAEAPPEPKKISKFKAERMQARNQ